MLLLTTQSFYCQGMDEGFFLMSFCDFYFLLSAIFLRGRKKHTSSRFADFVWRLACDFVARFIIHHLVLVLFIICTEVFH